MKASLYRVLQSALVGVFVLLWSLNAHAQDRKVTGTVLGTDGALPGANVLLKGTTTGTSTNADGNFTINVRGANPVLVISAIGSKTQEVVVGNQSNITVKLDDDVNSLDEVIVTGYSTDNRRNTTGAVSTVSPQQLRAIPSSNVEQQLQGRVAGVTVITNGQPGTSSQIRVRGFGSFGGNQPLYVVDGVPTQNISFINPDDIENTTVLKDAASASIYGARAAAGVIVLTTRKGARRAQKLSVSYDGLLGFQEPGKGIAVLNPQEQADWTWQARKNDIFQGAYPTNDFNNLAGGQYGNGPTPVLPDYLLVGTRAGLPASAVDLNAERANYNVNPANGPVYLVIPANKQGTDWYSAITRVAPISRHTLGFSGGTDYSRYYVSFAAQNQAGILKNNSYNRYTFRTNTEFDVSKKIRVGENLQVAFISNPGIQGGVGNALGTAANNNPSVAGDENDLNLAYRMPPIIPIYNSFGGYAGTAAPGFNNPRNPVANRDAAANNLNNTIYAFGNAYAEYDVIPDLTLRSSIGGTYTSNYYNFYNRAQYENSENNGNFTYGEGSNNAFAWTFTNTATYRKRFGVHDVFALGGVEALNNGRGRGIGGSGLNPFITDPNFVNLSTTTPGATRQVGSGFGPGVNFFSLFGQVRYTFNDKYILTGIVRRDGSSQFGANNRYGVFPAFSAAWRISSENFMKNLPWVNDLKIRGGYGTMGNSNNLNPTNQYSLYSTGAFLGYPIDGSKTSVAPGFFRGQIGNPNAKWETSVTTNIGFDGAFFNNKLELIVDVWRKDTRDLLYQLQLPGVVGVRSGAPFINIASMRNQGIDITAITRGNITRDLGYDVTLTGSFLQNRITSLAPNVPYFQGGGTRLSGPVIRNAPGQPISSFYGYRVIGLFQSKEEVASAPTQEGAGPGRFRYADINGDGKIDDNDRTFLGSPVPKFTGGAALTLRYKGFDLNTYLYTSLGNKIFNNTRWFTDFYPSFTGAAVSARVKDSWLPTNPNPNATVPIFENTSNFSTNQQPNSYYVENGSYLRMQYLSLGYTLPATLLNRVGVNRVRLAVQATNLFTITKYTGQDPGIGGSADTNFGIDVGNYPVTRGYNFSLSFGF